MALNGALNLWGQGTDALAVRVAVRARPMSVREKMEEAQECVLAVDNTQLRLGSKHFTFDAVYGGNSRQESIYDDCVRELVAGCFGGYNATVLAYGQTGSGKTHTMGSSSVDTVLLEDQGIIPRAVRQMFDEIHQRTTSQPGWSCKVFVSFLEIYNEEFKDLLDTQPLVGAKGKNNIALREGPNGSIQVVGASEESVSSYDDMLQCLEKGTVCRSVGSTSMNAVSSRSHAIFTVTIEQTTVDAGKECLEHMDPNTDGADGDGAPLERSTSVMTSKFHFVDLAGSERAKKTGAEGGRLKEGININYGLLVLGNVISALGDEARKGSHVPYRDSKLTRMLQDSIGGNSRTLMIACISPADCNFAESYNTITYANRARNIKNKPVVNRDARDAKMAAMLEQIQRLKAERDCALKRAGMSVSDLGQGMASDLVGIAGMSGASLGRDLEADRMLKAEMSKRQQDNIKLLVRLEDAETRNKALDSEGRQLKEAVAAAERDRDRYRYRLEEATGQPAGAAEADGCTTTLLEEKFQELEDLRQKLARAQEQVEEMKLRNKRLESDVQKDQTVFSVQNKKIHFLSKKNQALKLENEGLARISMSPMLKAPMQRSPAAGCGTSPAAGATPGGREQEQEQELAGAGLSKDSPTVMGEYRKKLDTLLSEHEQKKTRRSEQLLADEDEVSDDGDEDDCEVADEVPCDTGDVEAVLAEEEERRWRQGLLQTEVELRDWTSTLDSKEKLLLQLQKEKMENEKLKMDYEVRMQAYEEAVRSQETAVEQAQRRLRELEKVKGKDESEIAKLTKDHQQRVKELEHKMSKLKREEREYAKWLQQRDRDQLRINTLQAEIDKGKQSKNDLLRKMKEDESKYREWRERHHREVQQLKKSAQKAEYTIRKLERECDKYKAVLRRREEEKAAAQRNNREVALANANVARTERVPHAGDGGAKAGARAGLQVKTRSQAAHAERVDRFKMNRAKTKLKHMLEEYGQRGKLQAELARLKSETKSLVAETKELENEKDALQLLVERRAVSRPRGPVEAWGDDNKRESHESSSEASEAHGKLDHLCDVLEEKHTKVDYNRDRISAIDKKLKALPDFESSSGLWADDDTMEVPEAYAPIREANGPEAKFLLRFLFKKAAIFRESDLRARHQIELQRVAIEEQMRQRDQAVGCMRRAELEFEQRCTQLQTMHQDKCLLLYTRLNGDAQDAALDGDHGAAPHAEAGDEGSPAADASGAAATPGSALGGKDSLRDAVRARNEEIALLRSVNEELREKNQEIASKLTVVEQVVDAVAPAPLDAPSDTVRSLSERMLGLKKMLHNTKNNLNPQTPESPAKTSKGVEGAGCGTSVRAAPTFRTNVFDRLNAQRNKVGQSKYKKLEQICKRLCKRPVFVEWHEACASREAREAREDAAASHSDAKHGSERRQADALLAADVDKENSSCQPATVFVKLNLNGISGGEGAMAGGGDVEEAGVPSTPSHQSGSVFERLQDPKLYTGIHKRNNVSALRALNEDNTEGVNQLASSALKAAPAVSKGDKTPRGRLFLETPGKPHLAH